MIECGLSGGQQPAHYHPLVPFVKWSFQRDPGKRRSKLGWRERIGPFPLSFPFFVILYSLWATSPRRLKHLPFFTNQKRGRYTRMFSHDDDFGDSNESTKIRSTFNFRSFLFTRNDFPLLFPTIFWGEMMIYYDVIPYCLVETKDLVFQFFFFSEQTFDLSSFHLSEVL